MTATSTQSAKKTYKEWKYLGDVWERRDNLAYTKPMSFFGVDSDNASLGYLCTSWGRVARFYGPYNTCVEIVAIYGGDSTKCDVYCDAVSKDADSTALPNAQFGAPVLLKRRLQINIASFRAKLPIVADNASAALIVDGMHFSPALAEYLFDSVGFQVPDTHLLFGDKIEQFVYNLERQIRAQRHCYCLECTINAVGCRKGKVISALRETLEKYDARQKEIHREFDVSEEEQTAKRAKMN